MWMWWIVAGLEGLLLMDVTMFEPLLWHYENLSLYRYVSEKILHMHCVPTVVTSLSFIGFWHMSNG
jgi:hypothetical protein